MARYVSLDVSVFFVCKTAPRGELKSFAGLKIIPGMLRAAKVKPEFFSGFLLTTAWLFSYSFFHLQFKCSNFIYLTFNGSEANTYESNRPQCSTRIV